MSNAIRVYSEGPNSKVDLRTLRDDDLEVESWRAIRGRPGDVVVDVIGPTGLVRATLDLADLLRLVKRECPDQLDALSRDELVPENVAFAELLRLETRVQNLVQLAQDAPQDSKAEAWVQAYNSVFSDTVSARIFRAFSDLRCGFDYYDPDGDYDEDVLAFANALHKRIEELKPQFPGVVKT